jgi:hypothetical protein
MHKDRWDSAVTDVVRMLAALALLAWLSSWINA